VTYKISLSVNSARLSSVNMTAQTAENERYGPAAVRTGYILANLFAQRAYASIRHVGGGMVQAAGVSAEAEGDGLSAGEIGIEVQQG